MIIKHPHTGLEHEVPDPDTQVWLDMGWLAADMGKNKPSATEETPTRDESTTEPVAEEATITATDEVATTHNTHRKGNRR